MEGITLKEAINIGSLVITAIIIIYSNYKRIKLKKTKDNEPKNREREHEVNDKPTTEWTSLAMERTDNSTVYEENVIISDLPIEKKQPIVEIKQTVKKKKHIKHIDLRRAVIYSEILKRKEF